MDSAIGRIAYNFAVVILAVFFQYAIRESLGARRKWLEDLLLGLGFGAAAALSIFLSVPVWNGVLLDSKMILGVLSGFYGGWRVGLMTAAMAIGTRSAVGGMGALGGSLGVALCVAAGILARRRFFASAGWRRTLTFLALGATASVIQIVVAFTLLLYVDWEETRSIMFTLIAPTALVYTPTTVAIGTMFGFVDDRVRASRELAVAKRELEEANARLEERIDFLGQIVSGIAHELNSPLAAISSAARDLSASLLERLLDAVALRAGLDAAAGAAFDELARKACGAGDEMAPNWRKRRGEREAAALALASTPLASSPSALDIVADFRLSDSREAVRALASAPEGERAFAALAELASARRSADIIGIGARKASMTVRALGEYASRGKGGLRQAVDPAESLEAALALAKASTHRGVQVRRSFDAEARVSASGDRLAQVWLNLIRNAVQAMDYKGVVRVSTRREGGRVLVSVADDGPGIPEAARARIFEPFYTTKRPGEGLGLGLSVCRMIVSEYGGTMGFETGPGGTTFTVDLPGAGESAD